MGIFLPHNINYKEKPQQYGDFSFVQSSLFENADRIGIEPNKIALAMPMWNLDKHVDYSKAEFLPININIGFDKNAYFFSSSNTGIILGNSYEINNYPQGLTIFSTAKAYISGMKKWGKIICQNYREYPTWSNPYIVFSVSRYSDTNTFQSFLFYTGSSSNSSSGVEIPDKQIFSVATTHDNINSKLFVNGDEKYSYSNSGVIQVPDNRNLFIGREGRSTPTEYWNGNIFQILMIKYALSPDQIAFLSDNPYYLWQPRNKRTWFVPVDATGGNISSKTIIKFDIFQALSCNLISIFDIFKQLSCNKSLLFNIDNIVSESLISKFDIRKLLSFSCQINFDILGVNVSVNSNIQALFNIYKTTTKPFITKFDIHKLINSNTAIKFDINTQIATELKSVFNIRKLTSLELIGLYDMAGKTSSELICVFKIKSNNQNGIFIIGGKSKKIKFNNNQLRIGIDSF